MVASAIGVPDLPKFPREDLFTGSLDCESFISTFLQSPSFPALRTTEPPLVADPDVAGPKRRRLEKAFSGWVGEDANAKGKELVLWLELLVGITDQSCVGKQLAAMRESGATALELVQFLGLLTADKHRMYLGFLLSSGFPSRIALSTAHIRGARSEAGHMVTCSRKVTSAVTACQKASTAPQPKSALPVKVVEDLEWTVIDTTEPLQNRLMAGLMLICVFTRARWHEVQCAHEVLADSVGELHGFVELITSTSKTTKAS
eukprot:6491307-Amphidinium_carterae.2